MSFEDIKASVIAYEVCLSVPERTPRRMPAVYALNFKLRLMRLFTRENCSLRLLSKMQLRSRNDKVAKKLLLR